MITTPMKTPAGGEYLAYVNEVKNNVMLVTRGHGRVLCPCCHFLNGTGLSMSPCSSALTMSDRSSFENCFRPWGVRCAEFICLVVWPYRVFLWVNSMSLLRARDRRARRIVRMSLLTWL